MESRGHAHDALNDINRIRDLLGESYDDTSVLRELVQNADDAGATELRVTTTDGWPEAPHALLRGPAVLVLNDGTLTSRHLDGIHRLGTSTKTGDTGAIGKFGLGMKSIYHWCEAFFYLASADQPAAGGGQVLVGLLNPWKKEGGLHSDWDQVDEPSCDRLRGVATSAAEGMARWFCLWLPLRTEPQLAGKHPIVAAYPAPGELLATLATPTLVSLIPLLHSLQRLAVDSAGGELRITREVMNPVLDAQQRQTAQAPVPLAGAVQVSHHDTMHTVAYRGAQQVLGDPDLDRAREHSKWPVRATIDQQTGAPHEARHEATQHAAVVLVRTSHQGHGRPELTITDAAFLPVHDEVNGQVVALAPGPFDYQLLLHGDYLPDTGRKKIVWEEATGWNRVLRDHGVLPLVLPVVAAFAQDADVAPAEVERLTDGLADSELWREHRQTIGATWQWLRRLTATGQEWGLRPADEPFVVLPAPPVDAPELPRRLFPALFASQRSVVPAGCPRLTGRSPEPLGEPPAWLEGLPEKSLGEPVALDYLWRVLADEQLTDGARQWLVEWLRQALLALGLTAARRQANAVQQLVARLPAKSWVKLPKNEAFDGVRLVQKMMQVSERLLLPAELAPQQGGGCLTADEAAALLRWLASPASPVAGEQRALAVLGVLQLTETQDRPALRARCGDLTLFEVHDERRRGRVPATWRQLDHWHTNGWLFALAGGDYRSALQEALAEDTIYGLPRHGDLAALLFEEQKLGGCGAADCLRVLARQPALAAPLDRTALLKCIRDCPSGFDRMEHRKAVRYLLHGSPAHYGCADDLFAGSETDTDAALRQLAEPLLRERDDSWRVITPELERALSTDDRQSFGVQRVEAATVACLLDEAGALPALEDLAGEKRLALCRALVDARRWPELPWHQTTDERWITLHEHCYLESDQPVHPDLAPHVSLLRRPDDQQRQRRYQEAGVEPWSAEMALRVAVEHRLTLAILDALAALEHKPDEDLLQRLRTVPWIPGRGGLWQPTDVLNLPYLSDELPRLLGAQTVPGACLAAADVDAAVREHAGWAQVENWLLPSAKQALERLAAVLSRLPDTAIGQLPDEAETRLKDLVAALRELPAASLPGAAVLLKVWDHAPDDAPRLLWTALRRPASLDQMRAVLEHLAQRHEAARDDRATLLAVHGWFLSALVRHPDFAAAKLTDVRLRDRQGRWRPAQELTLEASNVADRYLVHGDHRPHLEGGGVGRSLVGDPSSDQATCLDGDQLASHLEQYLAPLAERLQGQQALLGGLLALLGKGERLPELADRYFDGRWDCGKFQRELERFFEPYKPPFAHAGRPLREILGLLRFRIAVTSEAADTIMVRSLTGRTLRARRGREASSLFDGQVAQERTGPVVQLRLCPPAAVAENERLPELVCASIDQVWRHAYLQRSDLVELLDDLAQAEQADLGKTQEELLTNAFVYLRQLKRPAEDSLRDLEREWDRGRYKLLPEESKQRTLEQFRQRLAQDDSVQQAVVDALRQRIEADFQYKPAAVPFELFQNADDAVVELAGMLEELPDECAAAVVAWDTDRLRFAHWGRRINQTSGGSRTHQYGWDRGYFKDLEKMLLLNASDKSEGVTGQFGLGFKSVFLLTDAPRVVSGLLSFEVVAGFWPRDLAAQLRDPLVDWLRELAPESQRRGTAFELPLRAGGDAMSAIDRFSYLAPLLLVFARRIRRCRLRGPDSSRDLRWQPRDVSGCEGLQVGLLPGADDLVLVASDTQANCGQVLFRLGARGFAALPADVPSLWVTTPTQVKLDVGLAVNGDFLLDVGRCQPAKQSDRNLRRARQLGPATGEAFSRLAAATKLDWPAVREALHLAAGTREEELWSSLLDVLARSASLGTEDPGAALVREVVWGEDGFARRLVDHRDVLPTELPEPHAVLTKLPATRASVAGVLDREPDLFRAVAAWPAVAQAYLPGTLISHERVARKRPKDAQPPALQLADAVELELAEADLTAERAAALAQTLTVKLLAELGGEREAVAAAIQQARFQGADGHWHPAADLLDSWATGDEQRCAGFAPAACRLADEYDQAARALFHLCRPRLEVAADELARWARAASDDQARRAALVCVRDSDTSVAQQLQREGGLPWLDSEAGRGIFDQFCTNDRAILGGRLNRASGYLTGTALCSPSFEDDEQDDSLGSSVAAAVPTGKWPVIAAWWEDNPHLAADYDTDLYPHQGQFLAAIRPDYGDTTAEREAWLTLFLRGALESMGRATMGQHRGFIQQVVQEGWLRGLAEQPEVAGPVVEDLRGHLNQPVQDMLYTHWLRYYLPVAVFARWVDDYAKAFLDADRLVDPWDLHQVLAPRTMAAFTGGGPDAPPLTGVLGIGACFVVRELRRRRILVNQRWDRYAYVPTKAVRDLVWPGKEPLLDDSRPIERSVAIFEFLGEALDDPTFGGAYDLPLQVLATNPELCQSVLRGGRELGSVR